MSSPDALSDGEIQALLARAVTLYAERAAARDTPLPAFPQGAQVTATERPAYSLAQEATVR